MSEIRTNVIISEESNEYRSKINLSVANLDNNLYDNHSAFRTNINISTTLKDGSIQSIKTILELGNISLDFYLVDMTKLNQSILYFSKFFNMYFEPEVMWNLLSQGTNEQINISHLSNALSSYVKNTSLDNINTSIVKLKDDLNSHISNKTIHLSNEEKSFLGDIMVNPPWTNSSGGGDYSESFFELIDIGNGEYALVPKKYKGKNVGIISDTFITAGGISNSSDSEIIFNRLDNWEDYDENAGDVLSAVLGFDLKQRIEIIERNGTLNETQLNAYLSKNKYLTRTVADTIYATSSALNTTNTNLSNHITAYNSFVTATNNSLTNHNNRLISLENMFEWDGSRIKAKADFYSIGAVTAGGVSDGGSIGNIFNRLDTWDNYDANSGDVLSAVLGYELKTRIDSIENSGVSGDYLPLSGGILSGSLRLGDLNSSTYLDVAVLRNGMSAYMGIQGTQGAIFGYSKNGDSKGLIIDSYGLIYDDNNTQYNLYHSGNIDEYPREGICVPYTTSIYTESGEDWLTFLSNRKSLMGGLYSPVWGIWKNTISVRHGNGTRDGSGYGMYITTHMTESGDMLWNKQIGPNTWQGERVIIDSSNIGQYITGGGTAGMPLNPEVIQFKNEDGSLGGWVGQGSGGNNHMFLYADDSSELKLYTGGVERLRITRGGGIVTYGNIFTQNTPGIIVKRDNNGVPYIRFTHMNDTVYGEIGVNTDGYPVFFPTRLTNDNWKRMFFEGADITNAAGGVFIHRTNEINCFNGNLYLNHRGDGSDSNGTTSKVIMCANGGNVIIGANIDTGSGERLQVPGSYIYCQGLHSSQGGYIWWNDKGIHLNPNKGSETPNAVNILNNGNVLIGEYVDQGVKLYVAGNFVATGEVTSGSDARYKRIESYAEIDIETIANAPIINFKWTDREDDKLHLGSTAQYWYNTSLCNGVIPTDDEKLWTMGYGQIALASVVSVAKKVVNHEERIKVLEEENKQLKQQLNEYRRVS